MPINLTPSSNVSSVYTTIGAVRSEMGPFNEQVAADPDNAGDPTVISTQEQAALNFADGYINNELTKASFAIPATASLTMLGMIAAKLAAYQLYQVRGLQDKTNAFQAKYDWARAELEELLYLNRGGFTRITDYSDAPDAVPATVDKDGHPVLTPPWPVPWWDGLIWRWG